MYGVDETVARIGDVVVIPKANSKSGAISAKEACPAGSSDVGLDSPEADSRSAGVTGDVDVIIETDESKGNAELRPESGN